MLLGPRHRSILNPTPIHTWKQGVYVPFIFLVIMLMKDFSFADLLPISWSSTGIPAAYVTKINLMIPRHRVQVSQVAPLLLVVQAA